MDEWEKHYTKSLWSKKVVIRTVETVGPKFVPLVAGAHAWAMDFFKKNRHLNFQERAIVKGEASDIENCIAAVLVAEWSGLIWNKVFGSRMNAKNPTLGTDVQVYATPDPAYNFLKRNHQPEHWRYLLVKGRFDFKDYAKTQIVIEGWKYGHDIRRLKFYEKIFSPRDGYVLMKCERGEPTSTLVL